MQTFENLMSTFATQPRRGSSPREGVRTHGELRVGERSARIAALLDGGRSEAVGHGQPQHGRLLMAVASALAVSEMVSSGPSPACGN